MSKAVQIVRAFYDAVSRADAATVVSLLHADLHWTEAEGFPYYSGTWRQPQDVLDKLLVPLVRDWNNFSAIADDFIVEGDRVVSLGAYSGVNKATGRAMRAPFAHVWHVTDGKLARFDMYTDTLLIDRAMQQRHAGGGDNAQISSS